MYCSGIPTRTFKCARDRSSPSRFAAEKLLQFERPRRLSFDLAHPQIATPMAMRSAATGAALCGAVFSESEQTHSAGSAGQNPHASSLIVKEWIVVDDA
jgi:hypothetical protein